MSVPAKVCANLACGGTFQRHAGESIARFTRRKFCGKPCATAWQHHTNPLSATARRRAAIASAATNAQRAQARRAAVIEDAEWIAGTDDPDRAANRLGYRNAETLVHLLNRWGRDDLARKFRKEAA